MLTFMRIATYYIEIRVFLYSSCLLLLLLKGKPSPRQREAVGIAFSW